VNHPVQKFDPREYRRPGRSDLWFYEAKWEKKGNGSLDREKSSVREDKDWEENPGRVTMSSKRGAVVG
jgi:hypothetical protein